MMAATPDEESPIEALAASMAQAEVVGEEIAEAAKEVEAMEAATAEELGLTPDELETYMDGKDEAEPAATGIVEALADLTVAQQDASEALSEGFKELEEVEAELAAELGVTVEELEVVEDSALGLIAPPPDGFEWGDTY